MNNEGAVVDGMEEAVRQFTEIVQCEEHFARSIMEEHNFNLERALTSYFTSQDVNVTNQGANSNARAVQNSSEAAGGWLRLFCHYFVDLPLNFVYNSVTNIFAFLYVLFFNPRPPIAHATVSAIRRERNRGISQLIHEQDAEYAQALAADRAKREEQRIADEKRKAEERLVQEELLKAEQKKERLVALRKQIRDSLPAPPIDITKNGGSSTTLVCVRMKFPCGTTHTHNFDPKSSLEELFKVVFAHERCPDDFSLVVGYPPQPLNCAPEWYREFGSCVETTDAIKTFEEAGLKSAVVLVRDNDA